MSKYFARIGCEDMPIKFAGDFDVNMKDNYDTELVKFMKDTFELDVLSDFSRRTTRSNSCSDMVLEEMWTFYPTRTTFRTLAVIDLS
jgi:hypothetical protein